MKLFLSLALTLLFFSPPVFSDSPANEYSVNDFPLSGRSIAVACAGCHGTDGTLSKPGLPHLKSVPADRTYKALLEFKKDLKRSTIMGRIAKGYSDVELRAVAEYFDNLPQG